MNSPSVDAPAETPFVLIGGAPAVRTVVDRFYDLMDEDPAYGALRALHAPDLGPMRDSLAGFLNAWLGGPRDWFDARPGACVMSAHAKVAVTPETARQWTLTMGRALADAGVDADLRGQIAAAFARMAAGMTASAGRRS
jgi:hemoglobin